MTGKQGFRSISNASLLSGLLGIFGLGFVLTGCSSVGYVFHAAKGQLSLYNHERSFEEVYSDPLTKTVVKEKLKLVSTLKKFVEAELGVKATGNYTTYVELNRPYVSYVVIAAKPNEVKAHNWCFPIAGCFPYLGFFDEKRAQDWADDFSKKGFETYVRGASAYSTLGYFRDPLLSSMLRGDDADLANLLFHETTHGYVYVSGQGEFNEGLATAIGDYGEKIFIERTYGKNSPRMARWQQEQLDQKKFSSALKRAAAKLNAIYTQGELSGENLTKKERVFSELQLEVLGIASYSKAAGQLKNNAQLVAHLTYDEQRKDIQDMIDSCEKQAANTKDKFSIPKCILDTARKWKPAA